MECYGIMKWGIGWKIKRTRLEYSSSNPSYKQGLASCPHGIHTGLNTFFSLRKSIPRNSTEAVDFSVLQSRFIIIIIINVLLIFITFQKIQLLSFLERLPGTESKDRSDRPFDVLLHPFLSFIGISISVQRCH